MEEVYTLEYDGKSSYFKYEKEKSLVSYVMRATPEMYAEEELWISKHGHPLYDIDEQGYVKIDSAGLQNKNWSNKESRDEYLGRWLDEIDEEVSYML